MPGDVIQFPAPKETEAPACVDKAARLAVAHAALMALAFSWWRP